MLPLQEHLSTDLPDDLSGAKMTTRVPLTLDVPADFIDFCALENLDPRLVLYRFACDLAEVDQRAGRAQHDRAEMWFDGDPWPERTDR